MTITTEDFLVRAKLDEETLEVWIREQWLIPDGVTGQQAFSEADLARAALIADLMNDLGVNEEGVGVVLNLVDQVHSLRRLVVHLTRAAHGLSTNPGSTDPEGS